MSCLQRLENLGNRYEKPCEQHYLAIGAPVNRSVQVHFICATVGIMCPAMSFLAAFLYYPYYAGFNVLTFLANWIKLVCFNFPFAFFSQLFFIQPLIRTCFKAVFRRKAETPQAVKA